MDAVIDGHQMWFSSQTGEVAGVKKWSSTTVTSSGGGGYVHPEHGGVVSAPRVSSSVHQHQTFWVISPNGQETEVNNDDILGGFSCREGQSVSLIWGARKGEQKGRYLLIRNNATNEVRFFLNQNFTQSFPEFSNSWITLSIAYFLFVLTSLIAGVATLDPHTDHSHGYSILMFSLAGMALITGLFHAICKKGDLLRRYKKYVEKILDAKAGDEATFGSASKLNSDSFVLFIFIPSLLVGVVSVAYYYISKNEIKKEQKVQEDRLKAEALLHAEIQKQQNEADSKRQQQRQLQEQQIRQREEQQRKADNAARTKEASPSPEFKKAGRAVSTRFGFVDGSSNVLLINGRPTSPPITGAEKLYVSKLAEHEGSDFLVVGSYRDTGCKSMFSIVRLTGNGGSVDVVKSEPFGNCNPDLHWESTRYSLKLVIPPYNGQPGVTRVYNFNSGMQ